jgi:hypothetical protein
MAVSLIAAELAAYRADNPVVIDDQDFSGGALRMGRLFRDADRSRFFDGRQKHAEIAAATRFASDFHGAAMGAHDA